MRPNKIVTILGLVVLMTSLSMSQYFAKESFDYAKGTSIDTLMGTAGNGFGGAWYKVEASKANSAVVSDTGLRYNDLNYAVPNVGRHLEAIPDTSATGLRWERALAQRWPDAKGTYWISLLMDVKSATDNSTWLGFKIYDGATGEIEMWGKGHGLDKYTVGSGWHGSAGPEVSSVAWTSGPVWIVGEIFMSGDTLNDPTYMWINPDPAGGAPDTAAKDAICNRAINAGFDRVRVEFGGTVGTGLRASFDEIRMGTTWGDVSIGLGVTGVRSRGNLPPSEYVLSQNYPNPFNPATQISYDVPRSGYVTLKVYSLLGQEIATLFAGTRNAGTYQATFNAGAFSSGVYFYRLQAGSTAITKKMVLMK